MFTNMAKKIGFLGCGKIGKAVADDIVLQGINTISYIQDPYYTAHSDKITCPIVTKLDINLLKETDIVVETALPSILIETAPTILQHCDMVVFSVTAFSDESFYNKVVEVCREHGTRIYIPHGAILGIDGLADAGDLLKEVTIETIKPPAALGRSDTQRTVLYEGSTREACKAYPRNVNVHACIAMAGVGFDKMKSLIISDPDITENCHHIVAVGEGFKFELNISSFSSGGVTGAYTPISACGSVRKATESNDIFMFV